MCRRSNYPTSDGTAVIFWCRRRTRTSTAPTPLSVPREQRVTSAGWRKRRTRRPREVFKDIWSPATNVAAFNYLGHILAATDNNWTAVVTNLRKERKKWV